MKIIDKLSTYAALIGVVSAIGGGFYAWGEFNTRLSAIEKKPSVNLTPLKNGLKETNKNLSETKIDLGIYSKDIYQGITLAKYSANDPIEIHKVQLYKAQEKTKRLQLELEAMRNENN